eukprot:948871-Prorocentrum_minimum.AAC.2
MDLRVILAGPKGRAVEPKELKHDGSENRGGVQYGNSVHALSSRQSRLRPLSEKLKSIDGGGGGATRVVLLGSWLDLLSPTS